MLVCSQNEQSCLYVLRTSNHACMFSERAVMLVCSQNEQSCLSSSHACMFLERSVMLVCSQNEQSCVYLLFHAIESIQASRTDYFQSCMNL
ncbi:hypothetical protein RRG08_050067 [Elysia crispata]|uniref:Uncharacterized protein n=1 Tax=Elysia crispata TaxID=231223 RepID=A0AAE1AKQ1_9GAST|nr:hypothetical protein RRG08_050067 [Elysia crispata]